MKTNRSHQNHSEGSVLLVTMCILAASLIALPIANLYLLRLYRNLADTLPPAEAPADTEGPSTEAPA